MPVLLCLFAKHCCSFVRLDTCTTNQKDLKWGRWPVSILVTDNNALVRALGYKLKSALEKKNLLIQFLKNQGVYYFKHSWKWRFKWRDSYVIRSPPPPCILVLLPLLALFSGRFSPCNTFASAEYCACYWTNFCDFASPSLALFFPEA